MTINQSSSRKLSRAEQRKAMLSKRSKVSESVSNTLKTEITFEDLDKHQLMAYFGIHEWWKAGSEDPLVIAGYAGCGKSALLSVALPALKNSDKSHVRIKYAAYTGKASNVLITKGLKAQTIHSLIYNCEPIPDPITGITKIEFVLKEAFEVDCELIVIDEASMLPDDMREDLESLGIPVIYTGDHGQLPPVVGKGNVMLNPDFKLEEPHRQALDSGIIEVATKVRTRKGIRIGTYGKNKDCHVHSSKKLTDIDLLSSADIVICYTNGRRTELNDQIREYKGFSGTMPQVGEKLICTRNNKNTGTVNGLIVIVEAIIEEAGHYLVNAVDEVGNKFYGLRVSKNHFQGYDHPKIQGQTLIDLFEFAYAITGHKSQGSQWPHVVVIEEKMHRQTIDLKRRWKYTTFTRAMSRLDYITLLR